MAAFSCRHGASRAADPDSALKRPATGAALLAICATLPACGAGVAPGPSPSEGTDANLAEVPAARGAPPGALTPPSPRAADARPRDLTELPTTASSVETGPGTAGLDADALQRVDSIILAALADAAAPGAALAVGRRGRVVRLRGYGTLGWTDLRPVTPGTLYDLASLTKVVGTTTAAMLLEADGALDLDAPVAAYLPWWVGTDVRKRAVTVRQLLLHRSGLAAFRAWFRGSDGPDSYREALAREGLQYDPGTRSVYSDLGFLTLGLVIEAAAGTPLDSLLETRVWRPLGMDDTGFRPDPGLRGRIAPTELDTLWRHEHVRGRVHDENADAMGGVAGHAGLFSSAWDLAIFADMMLSGGDAPACVPEVGTGVACTRARGEPLGLVPGPSVSRWTARADGLASYALGWDTPEGSDSSAGRFFTARAFGHTGFTGTSIWIDPALDLYVVLLTNRVDPSRENRRHVPLRRAVHDAVAQAVRDRPVTARAGG